MTGNAIQNTISHYWENGRDTGLMLLHMPTGTGKTWSVIQLLAIMLKNGDDKRRYFFITPLKKNLPYQDLLNELDKCGVDLELFKNKVLLIGGTPETVFNEWFNIRNQISQKDIIDSKEYRELNRYRDKLSKQNLCYRSLDDDDREAFNMRESNFRKLLTKKMRDEFPNLEDRHLAILENGEWNWIPVLYPASLSFKAQCFFMSLDKFQLRNNTIVDDDYEFIGSELTRNSIVIMDEFDSCKDRMLSSIIEDSTKSRIDCIDLFCNIHAALNDKNNKLPTRLLEEPDTNGNHGRGYISAIDNMKQIEREANEIFDEYHLEYSLLTSDEMRQESSLFLFNDNATSTVVSSNNKHRICIGVDPLKNQNTVSCVKSDLNPENSVNYMLNKVYGFLSYFCKAIYLLTINSISLDKQRYYSESARFDDKLASVIKCFTKDSSQVDYLMRTIKKDVYGRKDYCNNENDISFYARGFRYYSFEDSDDHDYYSRIDMLKYSRTPEAILIAMASTSKVLGISATANIPSVLSNYDMEYVRSILGSNYQIPSSEDKKAMADEFENTYKDYKSKVNIHTELIGNEPYGLDCWLELIPDEDKANQLYEDLASKPIEAGGESFYKHKYYLVAKAWYEFCRHDGSDGQAPINSFLCMMNRIARDNPEFSVDIIKQIFDEVASANGWPYTFEDNVRLLYTEDFDNKKNNLLDELADGRKIFVLTCYQSVGAGQNLQYEIYDGLDWIKVSERGGKLEKDFDAIYLDSPTNLIVNLQNDSKDDVLAKYLYQLEFLNANSEISISAKKTEIARAFKICHQNGGKWRSAIDTRSVRLSGTRTVIQAVGRICRTSFKNKDIYIYADSTMANKIELDIPLNEIYNFEFMALLDELKKQVSERKSEREMEFTNNYKLVNTSAYKAIENMLRNRSYANMSKWQDIRDFVLRYPIIQNDRERYTPYGYSWYVKSPENIDHYYFNETNDYRDVELSLKPNADVPFTMSAEHARLDVAMSNPDIRKYFEESGYATNFGTGRYLMSPVLYNNIYKGALGEVVGRFIFDKSAGIILEEINNPEVFEFFDYLVPGRNVYVDFKNWSDDREASLLKELHNIKGKAECCNTKKVIIANMYASDEYVIRKDFIDGTDIEVLEIPSLLMDIPGSPVNIDAIEAIRRFVNE